MSSVYGIISSNNYSLLSNYFGSNSGNKNQTSFSTSSLGDYALIRSGAYSKLMKNYYSKIDNNQSSTGSSQTTVSNENKEEAKNLQIAGNSAKNLYESIGALKKASLYESTGADEKGNKTYDYDTLYSKASQFVTSYNSFIKSFDNVDSSSILKKGIYTVSGTRKNSTLLSKIGIDIKEDSTLSIDKEKFIKSDINDIKSLFTGNYSFGDMTALKASQVYSLSQSQIASLSKDKGSAYTSAGRYTVSPMTSFMGQI